MKPAPHYFVHSPHIMFCCCCFLSYQHQPVVYTSSGQSVHREFEASGFKPLSNSALFNTVIGMIYHRSWTKNLVPNANSPPFFFLQASHPVFLFFFFFFFFFRWNRNLSPAPGKIKVSDKNREMIYVLKTKQNWEFFLCFLLLLLLLFFSGMPWVWECFVTEVQIYMD